jgi:uncharacterized protein YeaO (DUF488 family)
MIRTKRVYEAAAKDDGQRFLVDRLWPRGIKKEKLKLAGWLKEVAPSDSLRRWIHQDPTQWEEFIHRYYAELDAHPETWQPLLEAARAQDVTLLFSARDTERNNAVVLKTYLEEQLQRAKRAR